MSITAGALQLLALILTNHLLSCDATFDVFISRSQIESYFQNTSDFVSVEGTVLACLDTLNVSFDPLKLEKLVNPLLLGFPHACKTAT
jgi:hypothetical protein